MLKGWRTITFNGSLLAAALAVLALPELQAVLPDSVLRYVLLVVAVGNIWLRGVTTTPMGFKK